MKYSVFYKPDGTVISIVAEQAAISHSTGMASAEELEKQAKAIDMLEKTVMELTSLVMSDEAAKDGEQ